MSRVRLADPVLGVLPETQGSTPRDPDDRSKVEARRSRDAPGEKQVPRYLHDRKSLSPTISNHSQESTIPCPSQSLSKHWINIQTERLLIGTKKESNLEARRVGRAQRATVVGPLPPKFRADCDPSGSVPSLCSQPTPTIRF